MSALRVVLLAEGNGEVGPNLQRGPGSPIAVADWGPGHELFARAVAKQTTIPRAAIQFVEPLRTARGTIPKGSNLLHDRTLRQLLAYLQPTSRPDLIIVLVDADGEATRKRRLEDVVRDLPGAKLIAVAVQEFETWLICDGAALASVLSADASSAPQQPEKLGPSEAKARLKVLTDSVENARQARLKLAQHLDLGVLEQRCSSFAGCLAELQALGL